MAGGHPRQPAGTAAGRCGEVGYRRSADVFLPTPDSYPWGLWKLATIVDHWAQLAANRNPASNRGAPGNKKLFYENHLFT